MSEVYHGLCAITPPPDTPSLPAGIMTGSAEQISFIWREMRSRVDSFFEVVIKRT